MKKLIIITSNKGGIGKSAYAKLVLHTENNRPIWPQLTQTPRSFLN